MPGENIQDWSATAADNDDADTLINWLEGQVRSSVNNSARGMMAAHAKDRNLHNGSITTTGSANVQAFTSGVGYTAVPTGLRVLLKIGVGLTNTGAATLNMDGIGDVAIKTPSGNDLTSGQLIAGSYAEFLYDGTNWLLLVSLPSGSSSTVILNTTTVVVSAPATSVDFTTGITSAYPVYMIRGFGIVPSTDAVNLYLRVSEDAGVTWKQGATDYKWANFTANNLPNATPEGGVASRMDMVKATLSNVATEALDFTVWLFQPSNTTRWKNFFGDGIHVGANGYLMRYISGGQYKGSTNAVTGVRLYPSAGTIVGGTFSLYGVLQ